MKVRSFGSSGIVTGTPTNTQGGPSPAGTTATQQDTCASAPGETRMERVRRLLSSPLAARRKSSHPGAHDHRVFGVPLDILMAKNQAVPFVLSRLCMFIELRGMAQEGLFRISGNARLIDKLKSSFDSQGDAPLEHEADIASAAGLLKTYFRELPEPLIPTKMYPAFLEATQSTQHDPDLRMARLRVLIQTMPEENLIVLRYLCRFLHKVSQHEETTRMNASALGIVFGPNLFRFADDLQGLQDQAVTNQVVTVLIAKYYAVFEQPLTVLIPGTSSSTGGSSGSINIPALMINDALLSQQKRRSCSEERPPSPAQFSLVRLRRCSSSEDITTGMANASAQDHTPQTAFTAGEKDKLLAQVEPTQYVNQPETTVQTAAVATVVTDVSAEARDEPAASSWTCASDVRTQEMETDSGVGGVDSHHDYSPVKCPRASAEAYDSIPSLPKRAAVTREICREFERTCWQPCGRKRTFSDQEKQRPVLGATRKDSKEASVKSSSSREPSSTLQRYQSASGDTLSVSSESMEFIDKVSSSMESMTSGVTPSPPVTPPPESGGGGGNVSSEVPPLDLAHGEEPQLSEHRFSWPIVRSLATPATPFHKTNSVEAPLSPSAFRGYLNNRSEHLVDDEMRLPPSPPVGENDFLGAAVAYGHGKAIDRGSSSEQHQQRQLSKKMRALKKKIQTFEVAFEANCGHRPSHAEKMNDAQCRELLHEFTNLRKEMKVLQNEEDALTESVCLNWQRFCPLEGRERLENLERDMNNTLCNLADLRRCACRPERVEDMTREQVVEEKLCMQKALLAFESIHGRPNSRADRHLLRPLYERYRSVKRLVGGGSFQGSAGGLVPAKEDTLQPIIEHVQMDFKSLPLQTTPQPLQHAANPDFEAISAHMESGDILNGLVSNPDLRGHESSPPLTPLEKESCNLHELPLPELLEEQRKARIEKKRLRKILRTFEKDFQLATGRKVQREDRHPMENNYTEYKHVKARLRLMEALVLKNENQVKC